MATVECRHDCEFESHEDLRGSDRRHGLRSQRSAPHRRLHRIAEVRCQQQVSARTVSRRLGLPLAEVRRQEHPASDLKLSEVLRWQQVLDVPIAELLVEAEGQLAAPVLERSRMVKLMKTAAAIRESTRGTAMARLVGMLIAQVIELMPEVADVTPWPESGQRRTLEDYGRAARHPVSADLFAG